MLKSITKYFIPSDAVKYLKSSNNSDVYYFLIFLFQTFVLASLPSGFHSDSRDGWLYYYFTIAFICLFYPIYYYLYFRNKKDCFLREVIVLSVVARIFSFLIAALISITHIVICVLLKLGKSDVYSVLYVLVYYSVFVLIMVFMQKSLKRS